MTSKADVGDKLPCAPGTSSSGAMIDNMQTHGVLDCDGCEQGGKETGNGEVVEAGDQVDTRAREAGAAIILTRTIKEDAERGENLSQSGRPEEKTDSDSLEMSHRLLDCFEEFGDLADLQRGIQILRKLIKSTPVFGDTHRAGLMSLGVALQYRFNRLGELNDIDDSITMHKEAVGLTPHGHPDEHTYLSYLGDSLTDRFERLGEWSDLNEAISMLRNAVNLTPHGHSDRPGLLNSLGNSFLTRFEHFEELTDLEEALSRHQDAVELTPHGCPDRPTFLSSLGNSFFLRFTCLGELSDLENAISRHKATVDLTPQGHPHKPGHLNNLGNSLNARFERLGELSVLEEAISVYRDAVENSPADHPQKPRRLESLGNALKVRFHRLGQLNDLEDAIPMLQYAVALTTQDHPQKPGCLINLGNAFHARFLRQGQLSDLDEAITNHRNAVKLVSSDHPDKPTSLNALASSIFTRFECIGHSSDLEDAISLLKDAIYITSYRHPSRPAFLSNLSNLLLSRFQQHREISDLEYAILSQIDAVDLTPLDHPDKALRLNSLGNSFSIRFHDFGELSDLENAISRHRDAVELTPNGHPNKPSYLNSLGCSLRARFNRIGEQSDLEAAVSSLRDAVHLTPNGHTYKPAHLSNLGRCFITRYRHSKKPGDLEDAILALQLAVALTPRDHPNKPGYLDNLGDALRTRFEHFRMPSDLKQVVSIYSYAATNPIGPIDIRFRASRKWISCAQHINRRSLLHAFSVAVSLLPRLTWIGLPLAQRYMTLARDADVAREAAAVALDMGFPETAVEWLERGRSIVWEELFQLRSPFDELASSYPDHARRLLDLSVALERAGAAREKYSDGSQSESPRMAEYLHSKSSDHHALTIEREKVLREIRDLPGFEHLLLPEEFSQLRASAHAGPVVILNAAESRCDALIVLANVDHVIHVSLPNFPLKLSINLQNMLKNFVRQARAEHFDEREGKSAPLAEVGWESFLSPLWKCIVKPVLDALALFVRRVILLNPQLIPLPVPEQATGDLSRIFWCPTGPLMFLPLHAAGLYDSEHVEPGHKVFDFVVSSYVPSLSILAQPHRVAAPSRGDFCFLTVGQPPSDGLPRLPGVVTELKYIKEVIEDSLSAPTTLIVSSKGTVEEVLSLMKEADWAHFACHGVQDATDSGLCLADKRRLKVRDIVALSRSRGGLAFLSACQTATGHASLPDEAIHIAAGMLFAGYAGVVGTMWSISDKVAPDVARDVYKQLFQSGARPDHRDAARALQDAVGRLRDGGASFVD